NMHLASATSLCGPAGLAVDSAGNLYVADDNNSRVVMYPSGSTTATRVYGQPNFTSNGPGGGATGLANPIDVVVDRSGNLYVADWMDQRVVFYPTGSTTPTRVYGQPSLTTYQHPSGATGFIT